MLQIQEHEVLLALYRTVMEGKFAEDPDDLLVARSPYAAEACRRILAALDEAEHARIAGLDGARRELAERNRQARLERRSLDAHPRLLNIVRRRITELEAWSALGTKEKGDLVGCLAAPLGLSRELQDQLVAEGDTHHAG